MWLWGGELFKDPVAVFERLVVIEPLGLAVVVLLSITVSLCNSLVALGGSEVSRRAGCFVPLLNVGV